MGVTGGVFLGGRRLQHAVDKKAFVVVLLRRVRQRQQARLGFGGGAQFAQGCGGQVGRSYLLRLAGCQHRARGIGHGHMQNIGLSGGFFQQVLDFLIGPVKAHARAQRALEGPDE